jgi:hypothetical protein
MKAAPFGLLGGYFLLQSTSEPGFTAVVLDLFFGLLCLALFTWAFIDGKDRKMPNPLTDERIYVVAGNYSQAEAFARVDLDRTGPGHGADYGPRPWLYVRDAWTLKGRVVNVARVYYTGTWRDRNDMADILDAVRISAAHGGQ